MNEEQVEAGAFAIYRTFIRGGIGTRIQKRDRDGRPMFVNGAPLLETPDEAAWRRWKSCPETTRENFRREALECAAAMEIPHAA